MRGKGILTKKGTQKRRFKVKKDEKLEQWENSIEGILDSLTTVGDISTQDQQNNDLIALVLQKLPKRVREKVLDEVIFVHTTAHGTVRRLLFQKLIDMKEMKKIEGNGLFKPGYHVIVPKIFIILNFKCIRSSETKMNTVAHEIAHFINESKDDYETSNADIKEKMADDLAEKWGFKRSYKSYSKFKGAVSGIG